MSGTLEPRRGTVLPAARPSGYLDGRAHDRMMRSQDGREAVLLATGQEEVLTAAVRAEVERANAEADTNIGNAQVKGVASVVNTGNQAAALVIQEGLQAIGTSDVAAHLLSPLLQQSASLIGKATAMNADRIMNRE